MPVRRTRSSGGSHQLAVGGLERMLSITPSHTADVMGDAGTVADCVGEEVRLCMRLCENSALLETLRTTFLTWREPRVPMLQEGWQRRSLRTEFYAPAERARSHTASYSPD